MPENVRVHRWRFAENPHRRIRHETHADVRPSRLSLQLTLDSQWIIFEPIINATTTHAYIHTYIHTYIHRQAHARTQAKPPLLLHPDLSRSARVVTLLLLLLKKNVFSPLSIRSRACTRSPLLFSLCKESSLTNRRSPFPSLSSAVFHLRVTHGRYIENIQLDDDDDRLRSIDSHPSPRQCFDHYFFALLHPLSLCLLSNSDCIAKH